MVYAGVLHPDGEGARSLTDLASDRLHVLPMDVTSDVQVKAAAEHIKALSDCYGNLILEKQM